MLWCAVAVASQAEILGRAVPGLFVLHSTVLMCVYMIGVGALGGVAGGGRVREGGGGI
jgi:hypothetical protein